MGHVLAQIEASANDVTTIWVLKKNIRAQKFYAKHGFIFDWKTKTVERGALVMHEIRMLRTT